MEKARKYCMKVDLRKFYGSIPTEQLRALRDDIVEELKERAREARKNAVRPKPEFRYWTGKIARRTGDAFCRYRFSVEPTCINSTNHYNQSLAEVLVCKNCKHWHKDKDSSDVDDDAAWGECDIIECGSYGSDSICMDFEEKN